jgi:predicted enzyme involved in methoxymalonyl-ACP biosynthesis
MHQRTNQFNLTTRRLTEADIAAPVNRPERGLGSLGVSSTTSVTTAS